MKIINFILNAFNNFEDLMEHIRITWFVFPKNSIRHLVDGTFITRDVYIVSETRKLGSPFKQYFLFRKDNNGLWKELTKGLEAHGVKSYLNGEWEWEDRSGNTNTMSKEGKLIKQETYKQRILRLSISKVGG